MRSRAAKAAKPVPIRISDDGSGTGVKDFREGDAIKKVTDSTVNAKTCNILFTSVVLHPQYPFALLMPSSDHAESIG